MEVGARLVQARLGAGVLSLALGQLGLGGAALGSSAMRLSGLVPAAFELPLTLAGPHPRDQQEQDRQDNDDSHDDRDDRSGGHLAPPSVALRASATRVAGSPR